MTINRRDTMRVRCDLLAAWGEGEPVLGRVINMSADGLLLTGGHPVAPGTEIRGTVWVEGRALEFTAVVRFVGDTRLGPGHGAQLLAMSDLDRERWLVEYTRHVEQAIAQVPPSIGRYLLRRATAPRRQ